MKKQVLLGIAISIGSFAVGQNSPTIPSDVTPQKISPKAANLAVPCPKKISDGSSLSQTFGNDSKSHSNGNHPLTTTSADSAIGTSIYDLQTNSSVCNRIVLNSDGSVSATFTMAHGATALPSNDRGTGYNYYNPPSGPSGNFWTFGTGAANAGPSATLGPQTRLESVRVGWPNIGVTGSGAEIVVTHEATSSAGNIHVMRRAHKGAGAWTETVLGFPDTWPRMAIGGPGDSTVHIISQTTGASTPANPAYHGQNGAISYSRSLDGGVTWDKLRTVIPQIDSSHYIGFGGDDYAIDAKGDTIAIAIGGQKVDVILLKSIDNGTTWTKTIIKRFPIPMYDPATMITDTVPTNGVADTLSSNDGSVAVLLDHQGMAHVWYGSMRVICTAAGTGTGQGLSYFPYTDGLMYWNESFGASAPVAIAYVKDLNGDGVLNVYNDPTGATLGFGSYYDALSSMPSPGIDAAGNIYVSYSSIYEGANDQGEIPTPTSTNPGKSYRHTFIMRLDAGSNSWCNSVDITDPDGPNHQGFLEGVFGAMTRRVDSYVHELVQNDASPGDALALDASSNAIDPQSGSENDMVYYKVPIANVVCGAGVNDIAQTVNSIKLYPNPATNSVNLKFSVNKAVKANINIYNILGEAVTKLENQAITTGTILSINIANYKSGIYFVNSVIDGKTYSQKLIVE